MVAKHFSLKPLRLYGKALFFLFIFVFAQELLARAGGAGGSGGGGFGGGGGGDGGEIAYLIYFIFRIIPFPYNFMVAGAVLYGYIRLQKTKSVYNKIPEQIDHIPASKASGYSQFKQSDPGFDEEEFLDKVQIAFLNVQLAWSKGDISPARRYISDGVYQRFATQMKMMEKLKQHNELKDIRILEKRVDSFERSGRYDIIHVAIQAEMEDYYKSDLDSRLNSGGHETFIEYWSFIRKRGIKTKVSTEDPYNMFSKNVCPACGAALPGQMGELAKCEYCNAITNSGDYDWVLSEITQASDYAQERAVNKKQNSLNHKIEKLYADDPDFSVQTIEDKASNGFLQIITAQTYRDPKIMRRFTSDALYQKLTGSLNEQPDAYNRLFINDATLVGAFKKDNKNILAIRLKTSKQRVAIGEEVELTDPWVMSDVCFILMERDADAKPAKGSLYAHTCPSCSAPVQDSTNTTCSYCHTVLNAGAFDWVISGLMNRAEYGAYVSGHGSSAEETLNPEDLESAKVRDYALNNILLIISLDGKIDDGELRFARSLAKKWGYSAKKIEGFLQVAKNGGLSLQMPEDNKNRHKIMALMEKAARSDGNLSEPEKYFLKAVRERFAA